MNWIEIDLLDYLNSCSIEFGILNGDGELSLDVTILNTDNTTSIQKMKVKDIMYFTEYGTMVLPGKYILKKSLAIINNILSLELSKLIDELFIGDKNKSYIENQMRMICLKIQNQVKSFLINYITEYEKTGVLINKDLNQSEYLFPVKNLIQYIKCEPKFQN